MSVGYIIVALVLAVILAMSGRGKLVKDPRITESLTKVGVPTSWYPYLATAELAGALGLVVGIFLPPLGIAAAIGVVLYFVGAVATHVRAGDTKGLTVPAPLLLLGILALVLRLVA
jgi:uncharacterized membrane protein YphA (DoxX/SURF4 family)